MKERLIEKVKGYGIYTIVFFIIFFLLKFIFPAYYEKMLYIFLIFLSIFVLASIGVGDSYKETASLLRFGSFVSGKEYMEKENVLEVNHKLPPLLDIVTVLYLYVPPIIFMYVTYMN